MNPWDNRLDAARFVDQKYPFLLQRARDTGNEELRGAFVDQLAHELNRRDHTARWGRKYRVEEDPASANSDALAYRTGGSLDQRRLIDVVVGDGFLPAWSSLEPGTPDDPVGNGFWGPTIAPDLDDVIVPPPPPPPPPLPPPPGDALAILNRLDAYAKDDFERQIMIMEAVSRIGLQMATIAGHLSEIDLRLSELEARPAPEYVGSIRFLGTVTLRPKV